EIARLIAQIGSEQGISVSQLTEIISGALGEDHNFNCYPGIPGNTCYDIAFFFSLNGSLKSGGGHYGFKETLETVVRHLQGYCAGQTSQGIIIIDEWVAGWYEHWLSNLRQIMATGVNLEIYLVGSGGWVTEIPI
ncbi:MAG: hypothetical protein ABSH41_09180, partial [Syntrophobacteraceae bacterium]